MKKNRMLPVLIGIVALTVAKEDVTVVQNSMQFVGTCHPCLFFKGSKLAQCFWQLASEHQKTLFATLKHEQREVVLRHGSLEDLQELVQSHNPKEWKALKKMGAVHADQQEILDRIHKIQQWAPYLGHLIKLPGSVLPLLSHGEITFEEMAQAVDGTVEDCLKHIFSLHEAFDGKQE